MKSHQTIGNLKTGETLTLLVSEQDNNGLYNKYEVFLPARRPSPPLHYHTDFIEIFTVIKGTLDFYLGMAEQHHRINEGESIIAKIGQLHRFVNDRDEPVTFTVEARPAGGLVKAFQLAYAVANESGEGKDGLPANFLVKLYFVKLSKGYLPGIPLLLQKLLFKAAIFILRITGKKQRLDRYLN